MTGYDLQLAILHTKTCHPQVLELCMATYVQLISKSTGELEAISF